MTNCIFCSIVKDTKRAQVIYEDENYLAIEDINPQAPTHFLVIPKKHVETILDADIDMLGNLIHFGVQAAYNKGLAENGFRTIINCGRHAGQSVNHLHIHILGGRWFTWPPG
jgi:histidine triad (HIT) family protein